MKEESGMQRTPCPTWCDGRQCHEPEAEDRHHEGGMLLSVIYRQVKRQPDGTLTVRAEADELAVTKSTSAVTGVLDEIWVSLDMGHLGHLTLTEESMRRVWHVLGKVLAGAPLPS